MVHTQRQWLFEWRATYVSSLRAKFILAPFGIWNWVWPSMNGYRMFFDQTSTLPPSMHRKLTKHERCCMQNNQLPTDSHVELEENYNACWLLRGLSSFLNLLMDLDGTGGQIWSYGTPGCKIIPICRCEKRCRLYPCVEVPQHRTCSKPVAWSECYCWPFCELTHALPHPGYHKTIWICFSFLATWLCLLAASYRYLYVTHGRYRWIVRAGRLSNGSPKSQGSRKEGEGFV